MATSDILKICGYEPVAGLNGDGEYSGIILDFEGGGVEKSATTTTSSESSITIRYEIGKISIDLSKFNEDHNGGYLMTKLDINNISLRGEEGSYSLPLEDPISYDLLINRSGYNHRIEGAGKFTPGLDGSTPVITFDSTSIEINPNPDRESTDLRISGEDGKTGIEYIVILEFKIPSNNEFLKAVFTDGNNTSLKSKPKNFEGNPNTYIWQISNTDKPNETREGYYLTDNQETNYYGYLITGVNDGSVPDGGGDVGDTLRGGLFIGYKGIPENATKVKCVYAYSADPNGIDWTSAEVLSEDLFTLNAVSGEYKGICIADGDNNTGWEVFVGGNEDNLISPEILENIITADAKNSGISFAFQFTNDMGATLGVKSWYYVGSLDSEGIKNLYTSNGIVEIEGPNTGSLFIGCNTSYITDYINEDGSRIGDYQFKYELSPNANFSDSIIITPGDIKKGSIVEFITEGTYSGIKISGTLLEDLRESATNGLELYIRLYISDYENVDDRITTSLDKTIIWNSTINKTVFISIDAGTDVSITDAEVVPGVLYVGYNNKKLEDYGIDNTYKYAKCQIVFTDTYQSTDYYPVNSIYNISNVGECLCISIPGTILNNIINGKDLNNGAKFIITYSKDKTGNTDSNISFTAGYLYSKDVECIKNGENVALCSSTSAISVEGNENDTFDKWNIHKIIREGEGFPESISETVTLYEKSYSDSDNYYVSVGDTISITKADIDVLTCNTHISAFIEVDMGNGLAHESFEVYPGVAENLNYDNSDWRNFENDKLTKKYTNPKITITLDNGREILIPTNEDSDNFTTDPITINGRITNVKLEAYIETPDYTDYKSDIKSGIESLAFHYFNPTPNISGDWQPTIFVNGWDRYYYETIGTVRASIDEASGEIADITGYEYISSYVGDCELKFKLKSHDYETSSLPLYIPSFKVGEENQNEIKLSKDGLDINIKVGDSIVSYFNSDFIKAKYNGVCNFEKDSGTGTETDSTNYERFVICDKISLTYNIYGSNSTLYSFNGDDLVDGKYTFDKDFNLNKIEYILTINIPGQEEGELVDSINLDISSKSNDGYNLTNFKSSYEIIGLISGKIERSTDYTTIWSSDNNFDITTNNPKPVNTSYLEIPNESFKSNIDIKKYQIFNLKNVSNLTNYLNNDIDWLSKKDYKWSWDDISMDDLNSSFESKLFIKPINTLDNNDVVVKIDNYFISSTDQIMSKDYNGPISIYLKSNKISSADNTQIINNWNIDLDGTYFGDSDTIIDNSASKQYMTSPLSLPSGVEFDIEEPRGTLYIGFKDDTGIYNDYNQIQLKVDESDYGDGFIDLEEYTNDNGEVCKGLRLTGEDLRLFLVLIQQPLTSTKITMTISNGNENELTSFEINSTFNINEYILNNDAKYITYTITDGPSLTVSVNPSSFPAEGGKGLITCSISNPVNGATIQVESTEWIVCEEPNNYNIEFTVKENTNTSTKNGNVTIKYGKGSDIYASESITITQEAKEIPWGTLKLQYKSSDIDVELTKTERNYVRWSPNNKGSQLVGEFESLTKENDFYTISINGDKLKSLINLYPNGTNMYMEFSSDKSSLSKYYLIGELTTDIINILKGGENYTIQSSTNRGELKIGYRAIDIDNEIGELDRQYIKWSSNIDESGSWIRPILDGDYYSVKFNYNELSKLISYITNNRNNSITLSLIFSPDEEGSNLFEYKIGDFTSNHRESIITGTNVTLTNYTRGNHQFILNGDGIFIIDGATGAKYDLLKTLETCGVKIN